MIVAIVMLSAQGAPPRALDPESIAYTVRKGDTLERLSRNFLVSERRWTALLTLAGIRDPRRLPIGRVLVIPRNWLRFTVEPARLVSYRGTVRVSFGGSNGTPTIGATIGEGAGVETGANSFVTLILADKSKLVIPSQSRVRLVQLRRILLTGTMDYRIQVERGRIETQVAPLPNSGDRYRIGTPVSMTAVRGTQYRVSFDAGRTAAATEVLAGKVAVSPPDSDASLLVERAHGATTDAQGQSQLATLLPAPELIQPGKVQSEDLVTFHVTPVPGAVRYRVVLAADAGFVENISEQIADGPDFALADVPNGNQFVRVSAIAPDGLEGLEQSYSFSRRLASIHGEASPEPDGFRFRWFGAGDGVRRYRFQLMLGAPDSRPVVDEVGLTGDQITLRHLPPGIYYWRVGLTQTDATGQIDSWTDPEKLTLTAADKPRRRK